MYENLTYPVFVVKKFEQITYTQIDNYEEGQVFEYNPIDQIHIALNEGGFFNQIPNSECEFKAQRELSFGDLQFNTGDVIKFEQLPESRITDLYLAGFIKKIYIGEKAKKKSPTIKKQNKKQTKKKTVLTYSKLAKELNLKPKQFKSLVKDRLDKNIEDMKLPVSSKNKKQILEALS